MVKSSNLIIVSNRLPVNVTQENEKIALNVSSGGLISAMNSYMEFSAAKGSDNFNEKIWIGVPGCSQSAWSQVSNEIQGEFKYAPVFINNQVYNAYYNGMSNSVIWPLFHYFPSYAEYHSRYFDNYIKANEDFLEVILRNVKDGDTIWIHDYHLLPLAGMIRDKLPDVIIGFFLHIPFPSFELFRLMPNRWQQLILTGMLGADLVGFHTIDYASHFLKSVQRVLGADSQKSLIKFSNRLIKIDVFPISIDFNKYNKAFNLKKVVSLRNNYLEQFSGKQIIFSVDRLDYTKCVMCRLKGYDMFFKLYPEYIEKVVFILAVVPSRDNIASYIKRKREIDEFIGDFNARTGNIQWKPVIYQYNHLEFEELLALYTACDAALITPLRDGMNLVSKEFIASRADLRGTLLLSEMTGAARELTEALMINPNDAEGIAIKIKEGLEMDAAEQERRMISMQRRIKQYDVNIWAEDFLHQLLKIKKRQKEFEFIFLDSNARMDLTQKYLKAKKRLLLLDYDGTLVPFSALPSQSKPNEKVLSVLNKLAEDKSNTIYIISGRDSVTLQKWLGHLPVCLIAEHGAKARKREEDWKNELTADQDFSWKSGIESIMESYVRRCPDSFVEIKDYSIVWHYRNAEPDQARLRAAELFSELSSFSKQLNVQILQGNKIIEARVKGMDKGLITTKILNETDFDFILACGDDNTDEDMFKVLADFDNAFTLKIGDAASYAKFNLYTPHMTVSLLEHLGNIKTATIPV